MSENSTERHNRWKVHHQDLERINVWLPGSLAVRLRKAAGTQPMRSLIAELLGEALDHRGVASFEEDRSLPSDLLDEVLIEQPAHQVRDLLAGSSPVVIEHLDQVG